MIEQVEIPAEQVRTGDLFVASGDVVISDPTDYGTYVQVVARCYNGVPVIRAWDKGYLVKVTRSTQPAKEMEA